jgi:hypothetical protein
VAKKGKILIIMATGKLKVKTNDQFLADAVRLILSEEKRLDTFVLLKVNEYLFFFSSQKLKKLISLEVHLQSKIIMFLIIEK